MAQKLANPKPLVGCRPPPPPAPPKKIEHMNIVFLSGEMNPINIAAGDRRFMVVTGAVEPSNA